MCVGVGVGVGVCGWVGGRVGGCGCGVQGEWVGGWLGGWTQAPCRVTCSGVEPNLWTCCHGDAPPDLATPPTAVALTPKAEQQQRSSAAVWQAID